MTRWRRGLAALLALSVMAAACTDGDDDGATTTTSEATAQTTTTEAAAPDDPDGTAARIEPVDIEVALVWHQHQPRYPVIDGVISRPWVRLHATKDYVDMATLVEEFPDLAVTINLTPVLLDQLVELEAGVRDRYWIVSEGPVEDLSADDRQFLVDRFFDVNPGVVDQFPRYVELRDLRADAGGDAGAFDDQDLRDLRTLFHLAWLDPEMPESIALLDEVGGPAGARGLTDDQTAALLAANERLVAEVIPTHARLWADDRIEVITTPFAHPILPLIADTSLASVGDPTALLPREPFREYLDASEHVVRGLDRAEELLGQRPVGMWPGEGAVAQAVMPIFAEQGVTWVATGEDVLAQSLGLGGFARDGDDRVIEAAELYRPRLVETNDGPVHMIFRDNRISDLIGFEYSGSPADDAVGDLMARLQDIRLALGEAGVEHTPLVPIILDGENAWEHYPNDGRDFLRALYTALTSTGGITTTTPSRYLADHPDGPAPLDEVFPAAWFSPDFGTWIGETEEQRGWELLRSTRLALRQAEQQGDLDEAALAAAFDTMLEAEGSDWFWWYGADQDSGNDRFFDDAYRELLGQVYDQLGEPRPRSLDVPIIPDPALEPQVINAEAVTIEIDGNPSDWVDATTWTRADQTDELGELGVAVDEDQVALRIDGAFSPSGGERFEIYLGAPRGTSRRGTTIDDRLLGFEGTHLIRFDEAGSDDVAAGACISGTLIGVSRVGQYPRQCSPIPSAVSEGVLEIGIPVSELGALAAGDRLLVRIASDRALSPADGAIAVPVPDIAGFDPVVSVADAQGDDAGPGGYTYPTDPVFTAGAYDLVSFEAGVSGDDAVFSFQVAGTVGNPWGSPVGLSVQTLDVYLDLDPGAGTGRQELIDGRQARLADGFGWEAAVTIEGWQSAVATAADAGGYTESEPAIGISVLGEEGRITGRVPLGALPEGYDPSTVAMAVAVLSQEGFPSAGVRRVRDVAASASQWAIGGGDSTAGDTRILDAVDPDGDQSLLADGVVPLAVVPS